jgi:uncharacterized protein (TIGR02284 family)
MNRLEKYNEIVLDLLQIQQDRANTYEKMLLNGNFDEKINMLLKRLAVQSRNNMLELRSHVTDNTGSDPADRVEIRGDILREWHGLSHFLPDSSFPEIMQCFEINEMRTKIAYQQALKKEDMFCEELKMLLARQMRSIQHSFLFIQQCRERPYMPEMLTVKDERKPPAFLHERIHAEA